MLLLFTSPQWAPPGVAAQLLPAQLPGCLLVYLAVQARWVDREALATLFWPDEPPPQALRNLRANLHRVRALLTGWGQAAALQAERYRVQLLLPTDVARLQAASGVDAADGADLANRANDAAAPANVDTTRWLEGFRIPGFTGFRDWADAEAARWRERAPAPAPAPARALPGRTDAIAALRGCGAAAVVVLAEPGAGKSALLQAAFPRAPRLQGREGLAGVPYAPLADALRLLDDLPGRVRGAALASWRLDLARLLPELARDEALPPLDAQTAKTRLLEAITRTFESAGAMLLADDLQWFDTASLEWLAFVAHGGQLRWRGAARVHEIGAPLAQLLAALSAAGELQQQLLAPLSRPGSDAACRSRWPQRDWSDTALAALHAASDGNPFVLGELVAAGATETPAALPRRVQDLLQRRLAALPAPARALVDAAAVLAQPAAPTLLRQLAGQDDGVGFVAACETALAADLLAHGPAGLQCRHDLVRQAAVAALSPPRLAWLHGRAAVALAAGPAPAPLAVAAHWHAAGDVQAALAWWLRGAQQQHELGDFAAARRLWQQVAEQSADAALALRARLALAQADLLHDLAAGRTALEAVLADAALLADAAARDEIEGQAYAGLVDNAVFSGQLRSAQLLAAPLRERLPRLPAPTQVAACEVLIELAMREPDIDAAWSWLAQMRRLAPRRPQVLSYEAQIHWFGGDARAARDAFQALLQRHPEFCRGLTIENDLAVALHALGELDAAEAMARRSLRSWQGVPHTQTLSLLVLGSVLTSAGRCGEARAALDDALALGRAQGSALFEADALLRRARLALREGAAAAALRDLDAAAPLLAGGSDALRLSSAVLSRVQALRVLCRRPGAALLAPLQAAAQRSRHPLVQARLALAEAEVALAAGRSADAVAAAGRAAVAARNAGLQETLAEAQALLRPPFAGAATAAD